MATTNQTITKADGWIQITGDIISNVGGYPVEFMTNPTQPAEALRGHLLNPSNGVSASELPSESIWFISRHESSTLAVSV